MDNDPLEQAAAAAHQEGWTGTSEAEENRATLGITLYRVTAHNPYAGTEDEYRGLPLEEAAHKMDDLTGVGADVILADFDEPCERCGGQGGAHTDDAFLRCPFCNGTRKRSDPWEWTDPETGREVRLQREAF